MGDVVKVYHVTVGRQRDIEYAKKIKDCSEFLGFDVEAKAYGYWLENSENNKIEGEVITYFDPVDTAISLQGDRKIVAGGGGNTPLQDKPYVEITLHL